MKRPLLVVTLVYVGGVLLAAWAPLPVWPLLGLALATGLAGLLLHRARPWLLLALVFFTGSANQRQRCVMLASHDLRQLITNEIASVTLRGRLLQTPTQRVYEFDEQETWRTLARIEVEAQRVNGGAWQQAFGRVAVSTPGSLTAALPAGQRVEIEGLLARPAAPLAPGLFDYAAYLDRQGIYFTLKASGPNAWQLVDPRLPPSFTQRFAEWAKRVLARGLPVEDEPLRLLWAMCLGWQTALTDEVSEPFMRSGTMHVFAISGLHVALIATMLVSALRVVRVPRAWCGAVAIPLLWFYAAATGWQASAIRSTVMMTVIIAGWALRRPSDLLNSLAAAAFIILLWDPQQLFQAGFQLSFFVVLSLALFVPVLHEFQQRLLAPDPFLPRDLRPRWRRWLDTPLRWMTNAMATSLAAWIGSVPLVALYFHYFTPVSLLANLIVVPLSSLALTSAMASLVCGDWLPQVGELFNHSAWFFMLSMTATSEWAAGLPGAWCNVASPSPLAFACYYGLLLALLAGCFTHPRLRWFAATTLGLAALLWIGLRWSESRAARLFVLPLNGGHAIYFDAPGRGEDLLVDCGNESSTEFVVKPFLRAQGVNRLPCLVLTHGDIRQVGGAALLRTHFRIQEVVVGPASFRSSAYGRVLDELIASGVRKGVVQPGDALRGWRVLHPERTDRFSRADDLPLVLQRLVGTNTILLLSDLSRAGQGQVVRRYPGLRADCVISGLPAGEEPLADGLLQCCQPTLVIVADCEYPATGRANRRLHERLARHPCHLLYTRVTGAAMLHFSPVGLRVAVARRNPASSWSTTPRKLAETEWMRER